MATKIQWTDNGETWNPTAGCSKISPGCKNCYAIKDAVRLSGNDNPKIAEKYQGTTEKNNWTGKINLASIETLLKPFYWTRPRKIFVNSMSDLFHENIPFEWIDKVFAVMALSPQHTFQILTKRADRMKRYFDSFHLASAFFRGDRLANWLRENFDEKAVITVINAKLSTNLPNVWLGVSVENQKTADERIPLLLETPAAVRWLSCEPLLENIVFDAFTLLDDETGNQLIDWVVVGGESGNGARPTNIEWIRSIVQQCKSTSPVFVKQLGAWAYEHYPSHLPAPLKVHQNGIKSYPFLNLTDKKGGNIEEFPEDLRIREFPK